MLDISREAPSFWYWSQSPLQLVKEVSQVRIYRYISIQLFTGTGEISDDVYYRAVFAVFHGALTLHITLLQESLKTLSIVFQCVTKVLYFHGLNIKDLFFQSLINELRVFESMHSESVWTPTIFFFFLYFQFCVLESTFWYWEGEEKCVYGGIALSKIKL